MVSNSRVDVWQVFGFRIAESLSEKIDTGRKKHGLSRSDYVREALIEKLERDKVPITDEDRFQKDRQGIGGRPTHKTYKRATEKQLDEISSAIQPGMTDNEVLQVAAEILGAPGGSSHPAPAPSSQTGPPGGGTYRKKSSTPKRRDSGKSSKS